MSTIKVNKIENTATTAGGVTIDSSGHVTVDGLQLPSAGALSNRNLIINGAMQVAQRATSATGISGPGYHALDRIRYSENSITNLICSIEQDSDAPEGFAKSLKYTVTTVEGNDPQLNEAIRPIEYRIEGQDLQHLKYGTSDAQSLTLSFYVKTSVEGDYCIQFSRTEATSRQITRTYTISAAQVNTWQYRTVTIPGDTGSAITGDTDNRFTLYFVVSAGPDNTSTDTTSWGDYDSTGSHYGQTASLQNTLNATWQITGIQLEVGTTATPFEHRSYGDELQRCQRYYVNSNIDGVFLACSNNVYMHFSFPVVMRASPTIYVSNNVSAPTPITASANVTGVFAVRYGGQALNNSGAPRGYSYTALAEL